MNNKLRVVEGEATKTRKEYEKKVKDMDMKVNEIQFRLVESYSVVDRKGQENVRFTEENRTLTKLLEFLHLEEVEAENEDAAEDVAAAAHLPDQEPSAYPSAEKLKQFPHACMTMTDVPT